MKLSLLSLVVLLVSCSSGKDEKMNKLMNKKAVYEDSLAVANKRIKDYAYRRIYDSAQKSLDMVKLYEGKLKTVLGTIDSLQKSQ